MAKITKREQFEGIVGVLTEIGEDELAKVMLHEIELIDKRSGAKRGPSKVQLANEPVKDAMVEFLTMTGPKTATEIGLAMDPIVSVQKASQLLKQLREEGRVTKTEAHGKTKATFTVAG